MATETESGYGVELGITKIWFPYKEGTLMQTYPFAGPDTYQNVGREILSNQVARLSLSDGEQTASFLHAAYCGPEEFQSIPQIQELRSRVMRHNCLWVFNRNLWIPGKKGGVYVQHDPKAKVLSEILNPNNLEKELEEGTEIKGVRFSKDKKTAFAPRGTYRDGEHSFEEFIKNGFVIATCHGSEGANKLGEVSQSRHFRYNKPSVWIVTPINQPIQTVSALYDYVGNRLGLGGSRDGYASGVLETSEAGSQNSE